MNDKEEWGYVVLPNYNGLFSIEKAKFCYCKVDCHNHYYGREILTEYRGTSYEVIVYRHGEYGQIKTDNFYVLEIDAKKAFVEKTQRYMDGLKQEEKTINNKMNAISKNIWNYVTEEEWTCYERC